MIPAQSSVREQGQGAETPRGLEDQKASVVATDGTVSDGPHPEAIGGFCVVDVGSREEALEWAAKTAVACRCAQEVHEFMPDSTVGN